ncbi:MAG TPA: homoserine dehydrogenase [Egibacteraceae bacterium]|nr:homoserine dehydrogenase [Egibacteraceae bacterium]
METEVDEPRRRTLTVGLLGCGIVGSGVVHLLREHADEIAGRLGARLQVGPVAVRTLSRNREVADLRLTTDPHEVTANADVDIVVEVMGGIEPARGLITEALEGGKSVVTANKELVATLGAELIALADARGARLEYEAAVAGGIPIIKPLRESLAGDRVRRVLGILNGTTNYILTKMTEEGASFAEALGEAQRLGYAERDPTADIEGFDAAAKTAILASLAFDARIVAGDVYREGITGVTATDIAHAERMGYVIKLLGIAEETDGRVGVRVHPALIPDHHPLASVRESFNAVFVEGEAVGDLMFYGRGAGSLPTASAVVGDIITVARAVLSGERPANGSLLADKPLRSFDENTVQFFILLDVLDESGVLAAIAATFGEHDVSIRSVWQEGAGDTAQLLLITHAAKERDVQATLHALRGLAVVRDVASVIRVEGGEA